MKDSQDYVFSSHEASISWGVCLSFLQDCMNIRNIYLSTGVER
ncbi:MAG: hypothetical protein ACK5LR_04350 [Mangrovibacterium sp.]